MRNKYKLLVVTPLIGTLGLSGCATLDAVTQTSSDDPCRPGIAALLGAAAGAAIAGGDRKSLAKGAALGAVGGVAICMAINATTRQTRSAAEVESDYKQRHAGKLPTVTQIVKYQSAFEPVHPVRAGEPAKIESVVNIVSGTSNRLQSMQENVVLLSPSGTEMKRASKNITVKQSNGVSELAESGEYANSFAFKFPQGVSQGVYHFKTELMVNGQKMAESGGVAQLVRSDMDKSEYWVVR